MVARRSDASVHGPDVAHRLDDVTGAGLTLGAHHGGALVDAPEGLAEVPGAADEGHLEGVLVDVVGLVGRREDLGLVDVVDAEGLEDLGLHEVADARLGHDRDGHRVHDGADEGRVAHARHAAGGPDVRRHALEGHDRDGAGILRDARLVGRDDVHDDAALEHLGQTLLGRPGGCLDAHVDLDRIVRGPGRSGSTAGSSPARSRTAATLAEWIMACPSRALGRHSCLPADALHRVRGWY